MTDRPIVLLYHAVWPPPEDADAEELAIFMDPDRFAWQMADLARRGYRTLSLGEYRSTRNGSAAHPRRILLTFDDAYAHVDETVTPVLRQHGFSAVMFATWQHLGGRNTWDISHRNLAALEIATPDQLRAMATGPWEIASHGLRHLDLRKLGASERKAELTESRQRLSDLLRRPVLDLAYPYGLHDVSVRNDARLAGYRMAFTAGRGSAGDTFRLPRRPVRGRDGKLAFRLKTSRGSERLYQADEIAPGWAKRAVRTLLSSGSARRRS